VFTGRFSHLELPVWRWRFRKLLHGRGQETFGVSHSSPSRSRPQCPSSFCWALSTDAAPSALGRSWNSQRS